MELPPFILTERGAIITEVYEAFEGVSRKGGVSWSESWEIDLYIPDTAQWEENRMTARAKDTDTRWTQVVEDSEWQGETGIGGWNFLDPIAYRYYLPVQMVHCLLKEEDLGTFGIVSSFALPSEDKGREYKLNQWSLLDERQRRCVKRFLQYMVVADCGIYYHESDWEGAFNSYWKDIPDEGEPTAPQP